jgi:hypothetical protein
MIKASDAAVIFLCLLGMAIFLLLFRMDLNRSLSRLNETPVASVAFISRAALRRFQDRMLWSRLQKESPVYNGDFIRTAERSETAVAFPGGELVGISENSLVRVFVEDGVTRIDLAQGSASVQAGASGDLVLSFGENRARAAAGTTLTLTAGAGDEGIFGLQVLEGNVSLVTPAGEQEAAAGAVLAFNAGTPGDSGPRIVVFAPPPAVRFLTPVDAAVPVEFSWSGLPLEQARIEIARNRDFARPLTVRERAGSVVGTSVELSATLSAAVPPGSWWWRISGPDNTGTEMPAPGRLEVVYFPPPLPVSPAPESVYYYQTELPELRFQWEAREEVLYYLLEAADNPGMANPALRTEVRYNSLVYSRLAEGRWYWRVTPVFSALYRGTIPPSPVVPFIVSRGYPPSPAAETATAEAVPGPAAADLPIAAVNPTAATVNSTAATVSPTAATVSPAAAVVTAATGPAATVSPAPLSQPPLPAPARRLPENGSVINSETLRESRTVVFNWNPVAGADAYVFTLFQETGPGERLPVVSFAGPETSYTLADLSLLDTGRFAWRVEAVSREADGTPGRTGTPEENWFTVDIPQPGRIRAEAPGILYGR